MQHQQRLLLRRLHRHEAHVRPAHRLADRFSVVAVVLPPFAIGCHELRRHSASRNTIRPAPSTPCSENTFFARSIPTVLTFSVTSPLVQIDPQNFNLALHLTSSVSDDD